MKFKKVAIVGVGLIGGSLALGLKKKRLASQVVGVLRQRKNLSLALKNKAIDEGSLDLEIIRGADLLIIATPVNTIINLAPKIATLISRDCIVTDVGSTKELIVSTLENIFPNYVGSHPLSGSEKRGILNASPGLFKGSLCLLTPTKKTNKKALERINLLWKNLGAKAAFLDPVTHDKILSFVSHLAHIISFSLIRSIPYPDLKFASGGLKDTTRIASSEAEVWSDIILSNQQNILKSIAVFTQNLEQLKLAVKNKDQARLERILQEAKKKRDGLEKLHK